MRVKKETINSIVRLRYLGYLLRRYKLWTSILNVGLIMGAVLLFMVCVISVVAWNFTHPLFFVTAATTSIFGIGRGALDIYYTPGNINVSFDRAVVSKINWTMFYTGLKYKKIDIEASKKYEELKRNDTLICQLETLSYKTFCAIDRGEGKKWKELWKPVKAAFSKTKWGFVPIEAHF